MARKRTIDFLTGEIPRPIIDAIGRERFSNGISLLVDGLQHPRLNKQLLFTLLDTLLAELFPNLTQDALKNFRLE